jgi:hypothetical protein
VLVFSNNSDNPFDLISRILVSVSLSLSVNGRSVWYGTSAAVNECVKQLVKELSSQSDGDEVKDYFTLLLT